MANSQTSRQSQPSVQPHQREWEIAWEQTQKSPEYQNADSDMDREAMRLDVFRNYVAPNLSTYEIEAGLQEFNRRTAPMGDPTSGIAGDTLAAVKSGLWNVGGDIASAFTLGNPNAVSQEMKARSEEAWNQASPSAIAEAAAFGVDYEQGQGLGGFSFKPGSTLYGGYLNTVKGATSMVPMAVGGGVLGMGAKGLVRAAGITKKTRDAIAAGNRAKALAAMKQAETITKATQFTGQSALMGGMIGGGTADQAFNEVYNQPEPVLEQSEIYRGYLDQGMSREQARDTLARDAARSAFNGGFTLGAASGGLYGRFLDKMLKGGLGATTRLGNAGRGALGEGLQEAVESGGQQYLSNVAQADVGLNVDPMKDVIAQAATGTVLGAAMGGPMGGLSRGQKAPDLDSVTHNLDAAYANATNLENELSGELSEEDRVKKEAELEKTYRQIMDYQAIKKDLIKNPPKKKPDKGKPDETPPVEPPIAEATAQSSPSPTESTTEPLESEASWVDTNIDENIAELARDIRQAESNMRRSDQNGADIDDHRLMERDLAEKRALLERLKFLSFNRDKQHYFDSREDFYRWVDQSIGNPDEQAAAQREMTHRQIRQQPGGNYPTVVPGQQPQKTFMEELPPQLRAGMQGVLRDEAYQEAAQAIPSQEDIDYETEQLNRSERGERIIGNAKQLLGAHRRQKQFEQLKAQHEQQQTEEKPPVAKPAPKTPAATKIQQAKTETAGSTVSTTGTGIGTGTDASAKQRSRVTELRQRLEASGTPGNRNAATQLRIVSAALATHGTQTVSIDGHTLTITRGKVDPKNFNRFMQSLAKRVPKREERRKNLANAAARLIAQIGKRYEGLDDPLSKALVKKARRVVNALTTQNDLTLHYGSDQQLKIEDGQVSARELKAFRQWLEGPQNTHAGYWKNVLQEIQDSLKGQPRNEKTIAVEFLQRAIGKPDSRKIGYAYPDTRHVNVDRGEPDHQQMVDFIRWISPGKSVSSASTPATGTNKPTPKHRPDLAERLKKEAAARQRINRENAERRQQRAEETAREREKDKPRQQREAEREKSHRSAQEQRKKREEQQRKERQKPKLPSEPESVFAEQATHIWTNPETGDNVPVVYHGDNVIKDLDVYTDENGELVTGPKHLFTPTGNQSETVEAVSEPELDMDYEETYLERERRKEKERQASKERAAQREHEYNEQLKKERKKQKEQHEQEIAEKLKASEAALEQQQQQQEQARAAREASKQALKDKKTELLNQHPEFSPDQTITPWSKLSKKFRSLFGRDKAQQIQWAKLLESYLPDRHLIYADDNMAIFLNTKSHRESYVVDDIVFRPKALEFAAKGALNRELPSSREALPTDWKRLRTLYGKALEKTVADSDLMRQRLQAIHDLKYDLMSPREKIIEDLVNRGRDNKALQKILGGTADQLESRLSAYRRYLGKSDGFLKLLIKHYDKEILQRDVDDLGLTPLSRSKENLADALNQWAINKEKAIDQYADEKLVSAEQPEKTTEPKESPKKVSKPILTMIRQYEENEKKIDDYESGRNGRQYYSFGSETTPGGLTPLGQMNVNKLSQSNSNLYDKIVSYAQDNFPDDQSWTSALSNSGMEDRAELWSFDDDVFATEKTTEPEPLQVNPDAKFAVGDSVTITKGSHKGKTGIITKLPTGLSNVYQVDVPGINKTRFMETSLEPASKPVEKQESAPEEKAEKPEPAGEPIPDELMGNAEVSTRTSDWYPMIENPGHIKLTASNGEVTFSQTETTPDGDRGVAYFHRSWNELKDGLFPDDIIRHVYGGFGNPDARIQLLNLTQEYNNLLHQLRKNLGEGGKKESSNRGLETKIRNWFKKKGIAKPDLSKINYPMLPVLFYELGLNKPDMINQLEAYFKDLDPNVRFVAKDVRSGYAVFSSEYSKFNQAMRKAYGDEWSQEYDPVGVLQEEREKLERKRQEQDNPDDYIIEESEFGGFSLVEKPKPATAKSDKFQKIRVGVYELKTDDRTATVTSVKSMGGEGSQWSVTISDHQGRELYTDTADSFTQGKHLARAYLKENPAAQDVSEKTENVSTSGEPVQATAENKQKPPHLNFRKTDKAMNSGMLLPRVGKKFTPQEQQQLLEWVRARGLSAHIKGSGIYAVDWDSSGKNWDSLEDGLEEQRLAKQIEKDRQKKEIADQKASEVRKEKDENPAYQWIVENMGEGFTNDYNMLALARVLNGDEKKFKGLMSHLWLEPIRKLGIEPREDSTYQEIAEAIRKVYEKTLKSVKTKTNNDFDQTLDELEQTTDSAYLKEKIADIRRLTKELTDAGKTFPDPEQFMQDIENGNRYGFSKERQRQIVEEAKADLAGLDNGTVRARRITGTGSTKADAKKYLNEKIELMEFSLAHNGMMHTTNISNYSSTLQNIEKGQDVGFMSDEQLAQQQAEHSKIEQDRDQEAERVREIANQTYETGDHESMNEPLWLSFNVTHGADSLLAKVAEAATPEEKYQLLKNSSAAKQKDLDYKERIGLNQARKKNAQFGYFSIEPRKGYKLIKLAIDLKPSNNDQITQPAPEKASEKIPVKTAIREQETIDQEIERRQAGHDRMAEKLRERAASYPGNYDGRSMVSLAQDIAEHAIEHKRRLTDEEITALADKHQMNENAVRQAAQQGFSYEGALYESQRFGGDATDFLMLENAKQRQAASQETVAPTDREQRAGKRQRRMVEIDAELDELGAEMAAIFKEAVSRFGVGLDPVIAGKLMITGVKAGVKIVEKGAIKFADWADAMLGLFERHGISDRDAAPYLKRLYLATGAEVSDTFADQMDDQKTVRAFDLDSLLEPEAVSEPATELRNPWEADRESWVEQQYRNNPYFEEYEAAESLKKGKIRELQNEWHQAVIDHADNGERIPTSVLDSWIEHYGKPAFMRTFRGVKENAVAGYEMADTRIWDKTYQQVLKMKKDGKLGVAANMNVRDFHRNGISNALARGETVPDNVLNEYPELAGESHVSTTGSNLERDSGSSGTKTQVGQENVPHDSGRTGSTDARTGREDDEGRGRGSGDTGLSETGTTAGGTRSDTDVLEDHGSYGDEGRPADTGKRSGSRDTGRKGTHAERRADQQVENAAAATGKLTLEQKVELQEKAGSIPVKQGDLQNIRDTLPLLLPEQQEDVLFGETRLLVNGEPGVMFTNGTGTGKTFTGLGHIKRMVMDGKDNILIMAPSDKVANDWIQSGKLLGLDITQLNNTQDAGKGIVITTYENAGANDSLVHRNWDMVVADESHKLMQNAEGKETLSLKTLRAITLNPRGIHTRHAMLMADELAEYQELGTSIRNLEKLASLDDTMDQVRDAYLKEAEQKTKQRTALGKKLDAHLEKVRSEVDAVNKKDRTKVLFLSATPFAYHKSIPYADGYLFDIYGSEPDRHTGYNEPGAFERFFVENFGYRMRYNKLTAPDKDVDVGLMEREFNQKLKDSGALSGRRLEVDADYSRQFVLVQDAIGQKIDEGIELIRTDKRLSKLQTLLEGKFDYLKQMQMLEAIKASHAVERIRQHQALGRKVVVFHEYKVGGTQNPFLFRKGTDRELNDAIDLFNDLRPDLAKLEINLPSPIITLQRAFPGLLLFNGDVNPKDRRTHAELFIDDNNPGAVILVQRKAGKEGVSLHDTTGKHPRVLMDLGLPGAPTDLIQTEGRIYRVGQVTNAIDEYLVTGTNFEKYAFASKVASRASTAENLALGHEGRQLQPAIIEAFKDMSDALPSDQQGSGGKDFDRQNSEVSYYDRAKTYYFARLKRTSKNKSAEGTDYFATPEPAGLKMFEMAGIRRGESMLEPSAGHGAIARWFPEFTRNTFIEQSYKLAAELGLNTNGKILNQDFEDLALINKFDGIVMNPPFGVGGKTAAEHVEKAMKHTRDGGRIVALIPVGPAADKRFAKLEESDTAKDFYKVAEILLPSVTFKRAGTSVMGKIVVWEKQEGENNPSQLQFKRRDYTDITDIKELFDRLEDFTLPDRLPPEPKKAKAVDGEITLTNEMGNETTFSVMDSQHTKTNAPLYVVNMEGSLLDDQYKAISKLAREKNGFYIKASMRHYYNPPFGVTPKGKPTFTFKSVEDRNDFLAGLQEITTTEAETKARYRLAEPGVKGIKPYQAKTLQKQLDKALGKIVTVVQSEADLPQNLRDQIAHDGVSGQVKGIFDSSNNHTYVIADRAADLNDALATALHETVGHLGVRSVLGTALDSTLDRIYQSIPRDWKSTLRIAYAKQLKGKSKIDQNRLIAEEYLAHLAETDPSHGWVRQAVAFIRKQLRKFFPSFMKWTQNDIRQLLMDARKVAGQKGPAIAADIRYQSDEVAIQENIRKGMRAAKRVLKSHIDVTSAMHRPGIGDIDFIWGTAGGWPPKGTAQARKGQKGIAHIIEARIRKNKLSEAEAKEVLWKVIETIARGHVVDDPITVLSSGVRDQKVILKMGSYVVTLVNQNLDAGNHYLLTGYKETKDEIKESASDETRQAHDRPGPTHNKPTRGRLVMGAEADSNLNDNPSSGQEKAAAVRYQLANFDALSKDKLQKLASDKGIGVKEFLRTHGLGLLGGKQIAEIYKPIFSAVEDKFGFNPLEKLDKLLQKMTSDRSNYANAAEKIDQRWSKLAREAPAVYNLLSNVMHLSTLWQQDPRLPFRVAGDKSIVTLQTILKNPTSERQRIRFQKQLDHELQRKEQYDRLKKDWETLSRTPQAAKLYTDVENFYKKQFKDTRKALIERVNGADLDPHAKRSARAEIEAMFYQALNGPYFPLMRFGDYVITATDADGNPYRAHYETKVARDEAKTALQQAGYRITFSGMRKSFDPQAMAGVGKFSSAVRKLLEPKKGEVLTDADIAARNAILSEINQLTLEMLPEMSAGKRSMHRKGVPGYHENARRAFDTTSLTNANRIVRIRYGWQMEAELERMSEVAAENNDDSPLTDDQRDIAQQVTTEMRKRHREIMNPNGSPIAATLTNIGFFMYMGGSIGAGLVNMSQNFLIGLPQMAAQYGFRKTARVMGGVMRDYFTKSGKMPKGLDNLLQQSWLSLENSKGIPADERALIKQLVRDGTIETSQAHVLAQMADMDIRPDQVRRKDWYTKLMRANGVFFHNAEVANRQIMALTAYRLAKQKGQVTLENGKPGEVTVDRVRKAVFDAHYDYSATNRPRYFRSNWAKVFLLFKQYSQNTLFFLGRNFHQAIKGESPEVRRQARKLLGTTFAMHGIFAGALGLPTASVWLGIAGLFMGDEDDPVDPEIAFRNATASLLGKDLAHALNKGLFNALFGIDIHSRTSANDLLFRSSDYDMSARQEAMSFIVGTLGGPLASQAINTWVAADKIASGETWQGLEGLMPKFIRDGMRAVRYSTEGVQNSSGKTLLDDYSLWEAGWKMSGISSARESEVYDVNRAITGPRQAIQRRRSLLLGQLDRAETSDEQQQIRQQIDAFNDAQRERGRKWALIEEEDIRTSLKSRRKTREETRYGVYLSSQQEDMRKLGGFGMVTL